LSLESLIVTPVESFWEKRDSSRVAIVLIVTWVEFESPKIVTRVEWLTRVTLSLVNTTLNYDNASNESCAAVPSVKSIHSVLPQC